MSPQTFISTKDQSLPESAAQGHQTVTQHFADEAFCVIYLFHINANVCGFVHIFCSKKLRVEEA